MNTTDLKQPETPPTAAPLEPLVGPFVVCGMCPFIDNSIDQTKIIGICENALFLDTDGELEFVNPATNLSRLRHGIDEGESQLMRLAPESVQPTIHAFCNYLRKCERSMRKAFPIRPDTTPQES